MGEGYYSGGDEHFEMGKEHAKNDLYETVNADVVFTGLQKRSPDPENSDGPVGCSECGCPWPGEDHSADPDDRDDLEIG